MSRNRIDPLKLGDALTLYALISPYIEEPDESTLTAEFVQGVLTRMVEVDPGAYTRCVELMSGKSESELMRMGSFDILELFLDGLRANQVVTLCQFGKGLGYAR